MNVISNILALVAVPVLVGSALAAECASYFPHFGKLNGRVELATRHSLKHYDDYNR